LNSSPRRAGGVCVCVEGRFSVWSGCEAGLVSGVGCEAGKCRWG
jgi:hypothetical protein